MLITKIEKITGAMDGLAAGAEGATGALAGIASFLTGAIFIAAIAFAVTEVYKLINAWQALTDATTQEKSAADMAYKSATSKAFTKILQKAEASGNLKQVAYLKKIQASSIHSAEVSKAYAARYGGVGGKINSFWDYYGWKQPLNQSSTPSAFIRGNTEDIIKGGTSSSSLKGRFLPAQPSQPITNINFNGTTVGDQGIKDLLHGMLGTVNRHEIGRASCRERV